MTSYVPIKLEVFPKLKVARTVPLAIFTAKVRQVHEFRLFIAYMTIIHMAG